MKFAVFTDLHYDSIHDGDRRMRELIKSIKKENVDFVIELGDLCYPTEENKHIIRLIFGMGDIWNGISIGPKTSSLYIGI